MGKFDSVLDDVYGKEDKKITNVLDEVYGPEVEPITMIENEPTPISNALVNLNRGIENASEAITSPIKKLFTAPSNQEIIAPEELDMSSIQAVRDMQALIPSKAPAEPGYVPPAGITEGLEAAFPIAYQGTKKGIAGAVQAAVENLPITSFPTEPVSKYAQTVGEEAQKQIEQTIQEKQIRPGTVGGVTTDVASSMAQFLPIAGMSIIAPSVAPAGLAFLATVSGGDKYQKAKEAGFNEGEALAQGIAYGASEAIGEKIGLDYLLAAVKNPAVMSGVKTIFAQGLKQAGVEGAEEGLTQIIQNATDIMAKKARPETKGEAPGILQDVPYAMGVGAIAGGVTGGGLGAIQSMLGQRQAPPTETPQQPEQEAPKEEVKPEEPIKETPTTAEAAPQNMQATTDFLTRKPTITIGEAKRLQGEAIPEGGGMTIQPTAPTNKLDQLFKREIKPKQIENRFDFSQETDINKLRTMLDDAVERENFQPGAESDAILKRIDELENQAIDQVSPELLRRIQDNDVSTEASQKILEKAFLIKKDSINNPKRMDALLNEYSGIESVVKKTAKIILEDYVKQNFPKADVDGLFSNASPLSREVQTKIIKDAQAKAKAIHNRVKDYFENPIEEKTEQPSKTSPEPQQATKVVAEDIKPQPTERAPVKTPEIKVSKPRLAETPENLIMAIKEKAKTGVVGENGRIEYPTVEVPLEGTFTIEPNGEVYKITNGGVNKTKAKPVEEQALYDAIQNDQADVVLKSKWGGAGNLKERERKTTRTLHSASGLGWQPRPKSGPGMFGGATMQNLYEKGADKLFKMKKAYETSQRNADVTRDMGRVVDITEKEGKPVETEAPLRPRIGMFGAGTLQDIYEKIVGKKQTSNEKITIGDPNIAKKIDDAYDATDKIEMDAKKEAANLRQTVGGAVRQSMVDLFVPYLDLVKKDPARYEQALKKLHDVFYIPSEVEGFLNDYRDQILAPIKKAGKTYRDYSAYRMAKWTLTGRAKVKSKLTLPEAQQFIDSIDPQTRKLFEDITTNFHEKTWKPLLKLLEDSGLKDDKVINFIMDKENYSPFFPAKQMGLSYGSREYKPSGEIFKLTEKGYEGDIQDVLTSLMQKGISMLTHANINMAKLEGIDILKTMAPKSITKAKQSFKGVKKLKDSNGNEIEVPILEFDEPAAGSQMALMTVREDGKAKGYYVPQQFAEAFDNALGDPASFADALRYFSQLTQSIKNVWIDYNPPWQIFVNAMRDIPAAAIEMPGFKKPVKFLGKVIKKAPAAVGDYIPFFGDVLQQITGYDRNQFDKQVTQMLKDKKLLSSKDVQHLGDYEITVFDRIQNAFDSFPKDGESQSFLQGMKAFGKDIERLTKTAFDETLQESGEYTPDEIVNMTRRGGSPAFVVRGGGVLNSAIKIPMMFYNAMKEGWRAGKYFYQKDPVGFTIKASVPLGIFAFGAAAAAGAFGDEWKKAYLAIKKSDRENKLTFPLWWKDNGNIKYMALSVPQFLKPFMMIINEFASSNPSLADGFADALSNEMPSLNPILDIGKSLLAYGSNKPPVDRFGNPIMTQDQWTAGGSEKAIAMLKSISNQNLFGSYFKFPIKPSDKRKDWLETFYDASFGKIMKESYAPSIDTEEEDVNAAKARLLARQAIEAEESDPAEAERLREEMRKLGYTPSRQFMRSVRREMNIEREKKAGTITEKEAYEKRLRQQPKVKRKKYNELFRK